MELSFHLSNQYGARACLDYFRSKNYKISSSKTLALKLLFTNANCTETVRLYIVEYFYAEICIFRQWMKGFVPNTRGTSLSKISS